MESKFFFIEGPLLISSRIFHDERGFFTERFKLDEFKKLGISSAFIQDNFSRSKPQVLRGLHYQWNQPQGKLVTCLSGAILDIAVDIRKNSPTFGKYISVELSGDKPEWLWIPPGFAHGFCVLGNKDADILYKVDNNYNPVGEAGIMWNDSDLQIQWPLQNPQVSAKDNQLLSFKSYTLNPSFN